MREDKQMQQHKKNKTKNWHESGKYSNFSVNKPDKHNLTEMIKVSITGDR